jgi:hypothetical protein
MKAKLAVSLIALFLLTISVFAQDRGTAQATVKGKTVKITYGRPKLAGRDMLRMAKPGTVWRLGMNEATEIESTGDLVVGGKDLKAGKYSLWARKTGENSWTLAFHPQTGMWGAPEMTSGFVAEAPLTMGKPAAPVDQLTINLADQSGAGAITIQWGNAQLTGTIGVK